MLDKDLTRILSGPLPSSVVQNEPARLSSLKAHCSTLYQGKGPAAIYKPDKSFIKEGGSEPLEYIYVFKNDTEPQHWHYIGFGLSDIYDYALYCRLDEAMRICNDEYANNYPKPTPIFPTLGGFGFELTIRLKYESEDKPPNWPIQLMQKLARCVHCTKNVIQAGDHITFGKSLDNEEGVISHMLMTYDPELPTLNLSMNKENSQSIKFIQIVGVCSDELEAAREWSVDGILSLMKENPEAGGNLLVTDMRRGASIFELDPSYRQRVAESVERCGSDLLVVNVRHKLGPTVTLMNSENIDYQAPELYERNPSRMSCGSQSELMVENADKQEPEYLSCVYLTFSWETAHVLPIALKNRLAHGKVFHLKSPTGELLTTLIPEKIDIRCLVSERRPIAKQAFWLQLYISNDLRKTMEEDLDKAGQERRFNERPQQPLSLSWTYGDHRIHIKIVEDF